MRYFNPRSSCEERRRRRDGRPCLPYFNPRSSCEERRLSQVCSRTRKQFQSTLLMRGATRPFAPLTSSHCGFQSTLLMRGATKKEIRELRGEAISIHAPHARSDSIKRTWACLELRFQSTLLMRGATSWCKEQHIPIGISIHAPHARSDSAVPLRLPVNSFQSTLLMRGATAVCSLLEPYGYISIHAPHARSDTRVDKKLLRCVSDFNPRSSCEERRQKHYFVLPYPDFNPRSSCEERRGLTVIETQYPPISIHAPHARSDARDIDVIVAEFLFQSTLLMRGATLLCATINRGN